MQFILSKAIFYDNKLNLTTLDRLWVFDKCWVWLLIYCTKWNISNVKDRCQTLRNINDFLQCKTWQKCLMWNSINQNSSTIKLLGVKCANCQVAWSLQVEHVYQIIWIKALKGNILGVTTRVVFILDPTYNVKMDITEFVLLIWKQSKQMPECGILSWTS